MLEVAAGTRVHLIRGEVPVVLVAPHGGRRRRGIRRSDAINDLFTAEVTSLLAERLDAFAVINTALDRNDVDLHRVSALVARAPRVLALLSAAVEAASRHSATPLVLFVHGWNVSSLYCDIGIGVREIGGELVGRHPTVSHEAVETFVLPLQGELASRGLGGLVGHRYAASGADNATQLFSGRHVGHGDANVDRLSRLAVGGGVDAAQLELSIPLRWPGLYRDRLLDAVVAGVGHHLEQAPRRGTAPGPHPSRGWASRVPAARVGRGERCFEGESVQAVLADGGGLFMAIEPGGPRTFSARICIARPDGHLALFVCEAPWSCLRGSGDGGGLDWQPGGRVRYRGPAVLYRSHDAFVDLERGLGVAELIEIAVTVGSDNRGDTAVETTDSVCFGKKVLELSAEPLRRRGGRFVDGAGVRTAKVFLTDGCTPPALRELSTGEVVLQDGERSLAVVQADGAVLSGPVTVRIPVFRPVREGRSLKIVFGVADLRGPSATKPVHALYEITEIVDHGDAAH